MLDFAADCTGMTTLEFDSGNTFNFCGRAVPAPSEKLHSSLEGHHRRKTAILRRVACAQDELLSVRVIAAIASFCSFNREMLADIKPSFENDTNIVPVPPNKAAFGNREKVVKRDVEIYRKKSQLV